ncbi:MAG: hypothetical protein GJ680_21295 [Alteromonadaceae bacterium]|nr:hypothetical protein [Alteromonadaceae bacterium]
MNSDLEFRNIIATRMDEVAKQIESWDAKERISEDSKSEVFERLQFVSHTATHGDIRIAGVEGSGDFPLLAYNDCYVYLAIAQAVQYQSHPTSGLKEVTPVSELIFDITWLPDESKRTQSFLLQSLEKLSGITARELIAQSDYKDFKSLSKSHSLEVLFESLILPHASDKGNLAIQLRSTAELGAAYRLIASDNPPDIVLFDGTFALPFMQRNDPASLYFEHLKRLCCKKATEKQIGFFAVSKSHGLPAIHELQDIIDRKAESISVEMPDKWFLRMPIPEAEYSKYKDEWEFGLTKEKTSLPPMGAVTYLFQIHRQTMPMRLDVDRKYFEQFILAGTSEKTLENEHRLFKMLDFSSHDQRCYGYPYPIKAAHDRVSLTGNERTSLRKQLINAAIKQGVSPKVFRDASVLTGHR